MKKITFILFAFISGATFAQNSSAVANINAEIVVPIKIEAVNGDLNFGKIVSDPEAGGNVRVSREGDRTFSNPNLSYPGDDHSAAVFEVTAGTDLGYNIYIPEIVLNGPEGSSPMELKFDYKTTGEGTGSAEEFEIGGVLSVNADQAAGEYSGTVNVTVAYN